LRETEKSASIITKSPWALLRVVSDSSTYLTTNFALVGLAIPFTEHIPSAIAENSIAELSDFFIEIEDDIDKLVSETNRYVMLLYEIIRDVDESKLSKHNDSIINMLNIINTILGENNEIFNFIGGNLDIFQVRVSNNSKFIATQTIKEFNITLRNMIVEINNLKKLK
jgi:hypothetical protein